MEKQLHDILKKVTTPAEASLSADVWATVCKYQKRKNTRQVWICSTVGLASVSGLVIIVKDITVQFTQSGFYEYASLLSSDGSVVTTYWKEFALSLTEALPLTEITLSLILLFAVVATMRHMSYQYKNQLLSV